ncbi:MAG: CBS domain-containing protein [Gemmatimonadaceae bacterium]
MSPAERLAEIQKSLKAGSPAEAITVRTFLGWFGVQRRGYFKLREIRNALRKAGLVTQPDFEGAYIDSEIVFGLKPTAKEKAARSEDPPSSHGALGTSEVGSQEASVQMGTIADPTYRIGRLPAANRPPLSIKPDAPVTEAITQMMLNGFSQLPVMQSERDVKGIISWESIGSRQALGRNGVRVRDCATTAEIISADTSLFAAIGRIVANQYVLIRDAQNRISGIVTTSDLSIQFHQLAEPFLLLSEIENHVRKLIDGKFTLSDLRSACLEPETSEIQTVADLTFGEYVRLLQNPVSWSKLKLDLDRVAFVAQLDLVREIRNEIMHFDPDPVSEEDLQTLRNFKQFLQTLQQSVTN